MAYLKYHNDDFLNVARGLVRGCSVRNIFGYNSAIGTSFIPAWENATAYTYPTANTVMGISSTVSADNSTVLVNGLDSDYNIITETVTLSGTANTVLSTPFFRINDLIIVSGTANGVVSLVGGSTPYAKIRAGEGRNQASIFTVPANHSFYLNRIDAFCASAALNNRTLAFRNFVQNNGAGTSFRVAQTEFLEDMHIQRQYPFKYAEKNDIQFQLKGSAGTQFIGVFGEGVLIDESSTGLRS